MIRRFFYGFFRSLERFLHRPLLVLGICVAMALVNLVFDGSLLRLWNLHRDKQRIASEIRDLEEQSRQMEQKIQKASELEFIEKEARTRFDLVDEGDLVFVFAEESRKN